MTDIINMANWGGAQWVLLCLIFAGFLLRIREDDFWYSIIGQFVLLAILAWGGFWA